MSRFAANSNGGRGAEGSPLGAGSPSAAPKVPGYVPPEGTIERLRELRAQRRMCRDIYAGKWEEVLIHCQNTQHLFKENRRSAGVSGSEGERTFGERIGALLVKANLVKLAMRLHADVMASNRPSITVPEEFLGQRDAIARIRRACMFDGMLHQAVLVAGIEGASIIRQDVAGEGEAAGAVLILDRNTETFPVGPRGPDNQPTAFERRWTITRKDPTNERRELKFLRVERHRAGLIEQEAYATDSTDVLVHLEKLDRVPLAAAIAAGRTVPADRTETGIDAPLAVELASYRLDGEPPPRFSRHELDLIDMVAAAFSRLDRVHEQHTDPLMRGNDSTVDEQGRAKRTNGVVIDPDRIVEFIKKEFALEEMLKFLDRVMEWLLIDLEVSPALLSITLSGGNAPVSFESRSLQSSITLAAATRSVPHMRQPLERAWTSACALDTRLGLRGYDVAPVSVVLRPEMPKDRMQRGVEQAELLRNGLTSRRRAVMEIHGEEEATSVLEEIEADRKEDAALQQTASFGATGGF